MRAHGKDALRLRRLSAPRVTVDLARHSVALGTVALLDAELWIRRNGTRVTIPGLFDEPPPATSPTPEWSLTLARADVRGALLHHHDDTTGAEGPAVTVDEGHIGPLGAAESAVPFSLAATVASGGRLLTEGQIVRRPFALSGQAELTGVALAPLVELAELPLRLESGEASGKATLRLADGALEASGTVALADVKTIAPDPARPEDVMAFKVLRLAIRQLRTDPPAAVLERVDLEWPYVLVDRTPTDIFPFSLISSRTTSAGSERPFSLQIDRLHVMGARVDFRDTTLTPPYWRALANLLLDAERVEAPAFRAASVRATALVDEWSPLRVEGTVGTRTHLVAEVERLALPPFNAYLEGASPYTVSSGILSGRSEITLERSELEVDNHVVLSRLGLAGGREGDFVQRELGIPLTLALALMKDYRGNIELTLPFGGDLEQRSFEMGSVLRQAIVRAVRGAVLSPLNLLGRVLLRDGRIERVEIDAIPFPRGGRTLDDSGRERVAQVARVLTSHPELGVRVRGLVADPDVQRIQDEAALTALANAPDAEALRAFLRARLDGRPLPALGEPERARLEALVAGLPWPERALHDLASDRGAVAAAALILDQHVDPKRVSAVSSDVPRPSELAAAPGANIELREL